MRQNVEWQWVKQNLTFRLFKLGRLRELLLCPSVSHDWDLCFIGRGLNHVDFLNVSKWHLHKFSLRVALCYKFSGSYLRKELYFFSNHSINMWLHCILWSFHCKKADSLLIRPKGDWSRAFTYSTRAMNYTTLLYGHFVLVLHNYVPIFFSFFGFLFQLWTHCLGLLT